MSVSVSIPTTFRALTGGSAKVEVDGSTVGEVLTSLETSHPGFKERILEQDGGLRRFINLYIADEDVRYLQGLDTPVPDGGVVSIMTAVAGGA